MRIYSSITHKLPCILTIKNDKIIFVCITVKGICARFHIKYKSICKFILFKDLVEFY